MTCVICQSPIRRRTRGVKTCSSYCNQILKSGLSREDYERRESQIPHHEDERSHELDDTASMEHVMRVGMGRKE
jgi:predicted nucleic acid-binding Zn ribbon protein